MPSLLLPPSEKPKGFPTALKVVLAIGALISLGGLTLATIGLVVLWRSQHRPFLEQRAAAPTMLRVRGPAPQEFDPEEPPEGVKSIVYPSGQLPLSAWYALPKDASATHRVPALIYFHGGFAFGSEELELVRPFFESGFAVMTPVFRGENGQYGFHEMYWGELDDARAAVTWMKSQPEIDPERVYTFGHSAGGVISALISLCDSPTVRLSGSAGGTYDETLFDHTRFPFVDSPRERKLRVFAPNARWMLQKHVAFVGEEDLLAKQGAVVAQANAKAGMLEVISMPGDHFTSLEPALEAFRVRVMGDGVK